MLPSSHHCCQGLGHMDDEHPVPLGLAWQLCVMGVSGADECRMSLNNTEQTSCNSMLLIPYHLLASTEVGRVQESSPKLSFPLEAKICFYKGCFSTMLVTESCLCSPFNLEPVRKVFWIALFCLRQELSPSLCFGHVSVKTAAFLCMRWLKCSGRCTNFYP